MFPNLKAGAAAAAAGIAETVAAVYRAVPPRPERDHCVVATLGADYGVHLPRCAIKTTAPLLRATTGTTGLAAFGIVYKTTRVEELLLSHREYKLAAAIHTY